MKHFIFSYIMILATLLIFLRVLLQPTTQTVVKPTPKELYSLIEKNVYSEKIVYTTYHKYLMIDNGKDLIHLRSCKNPTHKKLTKIK